MTSAVDQARTPDRSLDHLRARLDIIEQRVRSAVARRRLIDPEPDDRFRGLYLSQPQVDGLLDAVRPAIWDADVEALLADVEAATDRWDGAGERLRLRDLARAFELDLVDTEILLVALAPDLDPRFESLYGYLHDDVTRRRASIGLALELCGVAQSSADGRSRLAPSGRLVGAGLLQVEEPDRPFLGRPLRVPDRVASHLLGRQDPGPELGSILAEPPAGSGRSPWATLQRALAAGIGPIYLRQSGMASGAFVTAGALVALERPGLFLDLRRLNSSPRPVDLAAAAVREARLRHAVLIAEPLEPSLEGAAGITRVLADAPCQVVLVGERVWDPDWSRAVPLTLETPPLTPTDRLASWGAVVDAQDRTDEEEAHSAELVRATLPFRLTPPQIVRAAQAGRLRALAEGRPIDPADLQAGARAQNAAGLDRLAHRIEPGAGWDDLVLPPDGRAQLHELAARARQRERVLDEWGIGGRASRGHGITALFAGESGTGKTLAAEVVAAELGLDLYVIDLSTVVDKYIGETEKNLDRIFDEADRVNGVLLFDEADAIFGKRSEVRDARDRYANVEVAYLLQRMERFDGLAVLTTNLRANLDEAFSRRIDVIVDFPMPEDAERLALWRMHLPSQLPQADDLDLDFLARHFRLSGGNIRNVCLTAAFLAADGDRSLMMADLIRGTEREYRKLGRLCLQDEFGPYFPIISTPTVETIDASR